MEEQYYEFYIPKNVSTRFELIKGIGIKELVYTGIAAIIGVFIAIFMYNITNNYLLSASAVAILGGGTFITNIKDNNNQSVVDLVKSIIRFYSTQKFYKYTVKEDIYELIKFYE